MPTKGTDPRRIRGIPDGIWEEYRAACEALYGTDNRSEVIRRHVADTVAEWRRRRAGK
jgi:hypothetical protein